MRKVCAIGVLLIIMAGCAVYTGSSGPQNPERKITDRVVMQIDSFSALIDSNGYYSEGLVWNGDMGLARVNKLLPFEFEPVVVIYK